MGASAAQFTPTKARPDLWDRLWTARAMSSLPVPLFQVMKTVESVGAILAIRARTAFSGFEVPTISSNITPDPLRPAVPNSLCRAGPLAP